jgi:hypothetical protein
LTVIVVVNLWSSRAVDQSNVADEQTNSTIGWYSKEREAEIEGGRGVYPSFRAETRPRGAKKSRL